MVQDEEERLQQEMGDVGDAGETVDERLWGDDDKPEEGQNAGEEKYERDAPVQARILLFQNGYTALSVTALHDTSSESK